MPKLQTICQHNLFKQVIAFAIIACSILLGVETFFPSHNIVLQSFDILFTLFFTIEILMRMIAERKGLAFFHLFTLQKDKHGRYKVDFSEHGFWNWFDFTVTLASILVLIFSSWSSHPQFLVIARLFRVMRVMRLLEISHDLMAVERKIVSIIPTIFSFASLLGVLMFIYAVIGVFLFNHDKYGNADFSSLGGALLTLFQIMTLDDWSNLMHMATQNFAFNWLAKGYFVSFVLLTAIISFNVFVAVLTSKVQEKEMEEQKLREKKEQELDQELTSMEYNMHADTKQILSEIRNLKSEIQDLKERLNTKQQP